MRDIIAGLFGLILIAQPGCKSTPKSPQPVTAATTGEVAQKPPPPRQAPGSETQPDAAGDDDFHMPCPQVLKLGLSDFSQEYQKQVDDTSESAEDQAAMYYEDCKQKSNEARRQGLPADTVARLEPFKQALAAWDGSYSSIENWGGTAARHNANRAGAGREDLMGRMIDALKIKDPPPPAADLQPRMKEVLRSVHDIVKRSAKPGPEVEADDKERYRDEYNDMKKAAAELEKALKALPPAALGPALDYLKNYGKDAGDQ